LLAYIIHILYFYTVNQAVNISDLSPEVALLLKEKGSIGDAILDINSLVLSKNNLLSQKENIIFANQKTIVEKEAEISDLQFQLAQLRRAIFGSKSERYVPENVDQLRLDFDMGE